MNQKQFKGINGKIVLFPNGLTLYRSLVVGFRKVNQEKTFIFENIVAIKFGKASFFGNHPGYISFVVRGGIEDRVSFKLKDMLTQENTLMFPLGKGKEFENLKNYIQNEINKPV